MAPFHISVSSIEEGVKIMDVLADYDQFQLDNNIKPDYCNMGGIEIFDADDKEDGPGGSWVSWFDENTGIDCPREFIELKGES